VTVVHIDIETYSELDLTEVGVYRYAEDPSTKIHCLCYAIDGGPVKRWIAGDVIPTDLAALLVDADFPPRFNVLHELRAWNANFERVMLNSQAGQRFGCPRTAIEQWTCTMVLAAYNGLPKGLDDCAAALSLRGKDKDGAKVMRLLCAPKRPTKKDPSTEYRPDTHPEMFESLYAYCEQDVEVERSIHKRLPRLPEVEQRLYWLDQEINDRGIRVDTALVDRVCGMINQKAEDFQKRAIAIAGVSTSQRDEILKWCASRGVYLEGYRKDDIAAALKKKDLPPEVREVLEIRRYASRQASGSKFYAAKRAACADGRLRGMFQFFGAVPTGRWAGRIVQLQNLSNQGYPETAPEDVLNLDLDGVEMLYGDAMPLFGNMTRAMLIPSQCRRFIVGDFSAIEARVLAWLAEETWRLNVFKTHGMIYEASAAEMFGVPLQEFIDYKKRTGEHHPLRKKGKVAELALGYYGGVNALIIMGALKMGLREDELQPIVDAWRQANPNIKRLWWAVSDAAINAVDKPGTLHHAGKCVFKADANWLMIKLPSGRVMRYWQPRLEDYESPWGWKKQLSYMGERQLPGKTQRVWGRVETHGGKLVENIDQGIARDCLREVLFRLVDAGYREDIVGHVHDEGVLDAAHGHPDDVRKIMARPIEWAPGLPLDGSVGEMMRYAKD
jgi:DNA polymerase